MCCPMLTFSLPNEKELMFLTGKNTLNEAIESAKKYTDILVIKRGNKGSMVVSGEGLSDLPPFLNKNVVDAIGAGDSFNAGFIYKYIQGKDIAECQRFGNLTGACFHNCCRRYRCLPGYGNFPENSTGEVSG